MELFFYSRRKDIAATSLPDLAAIITALNSTATSRGALAANAQTVERLVGKIEAFVQSDSGEPLTLHFYDDATTVSPWSIDPTFTLAAGLGRPDPATAADYTTTTAFTIVGNARVGRLQLNTTALRDALIVAALPEADASCRAPGSPNTASLVLHLRKADAAGVTETVALLPVPVQAGVLTTVPVESPGGGNPGGGTSAWGGITGLITAQADLMAALASKVAATDLAIALALKASQVDLNVHGHVPQGLVDGLIYGEVGHAANYAAIQLEYPAGIVRHVILPLGRFYTDQTIIAAPGSTLNGQKCGGQDDVGTALLYTGSGIAITFDGGLGWNPPSGFPAGTNTNYAGGACRNIRIIGTPAAAGGVRVTDIDNFVFDGCTLDSFPNGFGMMGRNKDSYCENWIIHNCRTVACRQHIYAHIEPTIAAQPGVLISNIIREPNRSFANWSISDLFWVMAGSGETLIKVDPWGWWYGGLTRFKGGSAHSGPTAEKCVLFDVGEYAYVSDGLMQMYAEGPFPIFTRLKMGQYARFSGFGFWAATHNAGMANLVGAENPIDDIHPTATFYEGPNGELYGNRDGAAMIKIGQPHLRVMAVGAPIVLPAVYSAGGVVEVTLNYFGQSPVPKRHRLRMVMSTIRGQDPAVLRNPLKILEDEFSGSGPVFSQTNVPHLRFSNSWNPILHVEIENACTDGIVECTTVIHSFDNSGSPFDLGEYKPVMGLPSAGHMAQITVPYLSTIHLAQTLQPGTIKSATRPPRMLDMQDWFDLTTGRLWKCVITDGVEALVDFSGPDNAPLATEAEARAGVEATHTMTPQRTQQAIEEQAGGGGVPPGVTGGWPTASIGSPPLGWIAGGTMGTPANTSVGADSMIVKHGGMVATPTFAPAAGPYTGPVTISCATSGVVMKYTTDGSTPSRTVGTVYSGPVTLTPAATLKVVAYRLPTTPADTMIDSAVGSAAYTVVDMIAPTLTAIGIPALGTTLQLTFDEYVTWAADNVTGITISASGGALTFTGTPTVAANIITLTGPSRVVAAGETLTATYVQPGAGMMDLAGNLAPNFTSVVVTNLSTAGPPTLVSATINAAGTSLTLVYSASVSVGAGGGGGYTLNPTGADVTLTYVSGYGSTTLVYTISRAILLTASETAVLDYVQPGNGIEATTGGDDVASYSSHAVVNNSTQVGAGAGTPWLTSYTPGAPRNDNNGSLGCQIDVGAAPITVSALGRWKIAGNSQNHTVAIYAMDGTTLIASAVVDMSTGSAGAFVYTSITPVVLAASTSYILVSSEVTGLDQFSSDDGVLHWTAVAYPFVSKYGSPGAFFGLSSEAAFGPPTFKYTSP